VWIQLTKYQRLPGDHGKSPLHYPGEVINVKNRAFCKKLIDRGIAIDVGASSQEMPGDAGILIRKRVKAPGWAEAFSLDVKFGDISLPFEHTLIWNPPKPPKRQYIMVSFKILRIWDVLVPVRSYEKLVEQIGTPEEKKRMKKLVHDLHVPFFSTGVMFVRRNDRTKELIEMWNAERGKWSDERLAFLYSVYKVKPFILPLPTLWIASK